MLSGNRVLSLEEGQCVCTGINAEDYALIGKEKLAGYHETLLYCEQVLSNEVDDNE